MKVARQIDLSLSFSLSLSLSVFPLLIILHSCIIKLLTNFLSGDDKNILYLKK